MASRGHLEMSNQAPESSDMASARSGAFDSLLPAAIAKRAEETGARRRHRNPDVLHDAIHVRRRRRRPDGPFDREGEGRTRRDAGACSGRHVQHARLPCRLDVLQRANDRRPHHHHRPADRGVRRRRLRAQHCECLFPDHRPSDQGLGARDVLAGHQSISGRFQRPDMEVCGV